MLLETIKIYSIIEIAYWNLDPPTYYAINSNEKHLNLIKSGVITKIAT